MSKRNYDEAKVVRILSKKKSIRINIVDKIIEVIKGSDEIGNGSWGKIDYLRKVHGYTQVFVAAIKGKPTITYDEDGMSVREYKKEKKLNMAAMVKANMRKVRVK